MAPALDPFSDRNHNSKVTYLWIRNYGLYVVDRRKRHIVLAQPLGPLRQRASPKDRVELLAQGLVVLNARQPSTKPCVVDERFRFGRQDQSLPEFFEGRKMYREQAAIGGSQDVSLRQAWPIRRLGVHAERKVGGKRLDCEMRHRFKHRDLEVLSSMCAGTFKQRAKDPVCRIDAGNGVG